MTDLNLRVFDNTLSKVVVGSPCLQFFWRLGCFNGSSKGVELESVETFYRSRFAVFRHQGQCRSVVKSTKCGKGWQRKAKSEARVQKKWLKVR